MTSTMSSSTSRFHRQQVRNARPVNRPNVQVTSHLDPQHRPEVNAFHNVQRYVERTRRHRKERSNARIVATEDAEYDGAPDVCPLCRDQLYAGESVLRLVCRHVYHVDCWSEWLARGTFLSCLVCRGGCHIIARFRMPELPLPNNSEQTPASEVSRPATPERRAPVPDPFNIFTPQNMPTRQASGSPEGTPFLLPEDTSGQYPWWPGQEDQNKQPHSIL